ncbi:MAG: hypothetical protein KatS3mg013_1753 [Actinomycetota bacterium]|jgi:hypothetical protein|nr:MAG: hypothetical protein KatS3mg013_1753 [Actinomycetota bacterium]
MNELEQIRGWFAGRLPDDWFTGPPEIEADRDEILVVGPLPEPELGADATDEARAVAIEARVQGFRDDTRARRIRIAQQAERRFGRAVSWGVTCAGRRVLFTTLSVPTMTRLRMPERRVLDTLVDAGVARSRSHALAWCVALVAERQDEWLADLRAALRAVEEVRASGPRAR